MGYRKVGYLEQIFYIIKYKVSAAIKKWKARVIQRFRK